MNLNALNEASTEKFLNFEYVLGHPNLKRNAELKRNLKLLQIHDTFEK